jgi:sec-independent protein translocase protein TatA
MLFFIGAPEIVFILVIILLLFGSKKIPEVARSLGKGIREFQKATDDIKKQMSEVDKIDLDVNDKKLHDEGSNAKP